ncbi:hypothetical protein AVEN_199378-1 [Araneus ventricosus]|uniref:Uncharacterized protein n=1 Tax=Araneus ventricosus TaxID=182803 RepID=A0A4Y2P2C7_ARAVE|nr:hypothetical protein AVEN_7262-1 [Araneus ventricosus]GBN44680.1 hypothetical protein AVEN_43486-1 [Araneus ventricosus]GBN44697.1 hypothetical protein AVEN_76961-1 [Araneus ventricosus]GBN44756.1 hypothetical protein AVEN_199378-1 [Araneus ventricosus]
MFSGGFSDEFHNLLNCLCVCEGNYSQPSIGTSSCINFRNSRELISLRAGGDVISLPVNEIYAVCCSKVNGRNSEFTNIISIWAYFHCLDNSKSCKGSNLASLIS